MRIKEKGLNLINNLIVWLIKTIATIGVWFEKKDKDEDKHEWF